MIGPAFLQAHRLATWRSDNPFLVLAAGRCGSTMLNMRIDSHPGAKAKGEVFHRQGPAMLARRTRLPVSMQQRLAAYLENMRRTDPSGYAEVFGWRTLRRWETVGFKALWALILNFTEDARQKLLSMPGLKIVVLDRRDTLAQFVSDEITERAGWYHLYVGEARRPVDKVPLDPRRFAFYVAARKRQRAVIIEAIGERPHLRLTYEDLVAYPEREHERLCDHLSIAPARLHDRTVKIADRPLHERVSNWTEFAAALRGSALEACLETHQIAATTPPARLFDGWRASR